MIQLEISIADLIEAVQDASENDAQVLAALIHLLLGDENGVALGA
jgi:hypothetical protein